MQKNYRKTLAACYLGFITQAITANFAPLLFLKFHADYHISLGQIALIPTAFFLTQLLVDVFCAWFVDAIGYRRSVILSEITSGLGLAGLAVIPDLFSDPFTGILVCVIIYAIGSGLIEVVVSPIVEACPFEHKDAVMSLLHSFYCWGSVGVILLSTLFFALFGIENWRILACIWALIPLYNIWNFATCPIERLTEEGKGMTVGALFKTPLFWLAIVLMICAGASELSMAQWASAYTEAALGFPKTVGDLIGPCLFAVTMGICRVIYTISITSPRLPQGGTALFALLAMAGDLGGAFGPSLVGTVTQQAGDSLQSGMLVGSVFPLVMVLSLFVMNRRYSGREKGTGIQ